MGSFFEVLRKRLTASDISRFNEKLHPRDEHGRFASKPGGSGGAGTARPGDALRGPRVETRVPPGWRIRPAYGGQFAATGPRGEYNVLPTIEQAIGYAQTGGKDRPGFTPARSQTRSRYPRLVLKARQKILSGRGSTRDRWSREIAGERIYSREREALHQDIIDAMMRMVDGKIEPDPAKRGPRRTSARERGLTPKVFFTGGGYAGGKGGVVDYMNDGKGHEFKQELEERGDPIIMDPDKIKAMIPEFAELRSQGDPEANLRVYEEAWDVAQALVKRIQEEGHDVIMDGVGDTSVEDALNRARNFVSHGYDVPKAVYVTTPVEKAIANSRKRMQDAIEAGKLESIRYIPEDLMADTHGKIAQILPDVIKDWPGELELYDTDTRRPDGGFDPPIRILRREADGRITVYREDLYQQALARKRYATA